MGRPRGKTKPSRPYTFSIRPSESCSIFLKQSKKSQDILSDNIIPMLDEVADRERVSRSELIKRSILAYLGDHYEGNFQTVLMSYGEGGTKSQGQHEEALFRDLSKQDSVVFIRLREQIRGMLGVEGRELNVVLNRMARRLHDEGVKVWR